jgi:hypothetical protein
MTTYVLVFWKKKYIDEFSSTQGVPRPSTALQENASEEEKIKAMFQQQNQHWENTQSQMATYVFQSIFL